ncbi:hypothetical protein ASPBRDRAFT_357382 [Aspergillus brasiliensis CBS 101740]|uniref:Uncharacterized protein n=1 Tax=Aspergillus brasiliensis (strain CBS 101740 / IMI 381727 / IBT 21946) TaxID=767769 RepID=A0A1L9U5V2_ASPBC|nr:hypothetical protein ASPBRDRAFT_357382 [Aspergillus brasiliensis CBS 101740]
MGRSLTQKLSSVIGFGWTQVSTNTAIWHLSSWKFSATFSPSMACLGDSSRNFPNNIQNSSWRVEQKETVVNRKYSVVFHVIRPASCSYRVLFQIKIHVSGNNMIHDKGKLLLGPHGSGTSICSHFKRYDRSDHRVVVERQSRIFNKTPSCVRITSLQRRVQVQHTIMPGSLF